MGKLTLTTAEKPVLERLRRICLALPETHQADSWGHPNFKVGKKIFLSLGRYDEHLSIGFKPGLETYRRLARDPRSFIPAYVGHLGWLSLYMRGRVDWREIEAIAHESYREVALKRQVKLLDEQLGSVEAKPKSPAKKRAKRPARKP